MNTQFTECAKEASELLKRMIATPSFSREENEVADLLMECISQKGYEAKRIENNVWMSGHYDPKRPTLLLNSHIDTVKPAVVWNNEAFIPTVKDGKLYGLGSNDAGASVVTLLQLFLILVEREQAYNLIYLASAEEEVSGKQGVELALQSLPHIDFAIVGEPTGMNLAVAEKGLMVLDCTVKGKAGHAARDEGENAIYKALKAISWFRDYRFPQVSPFLGAVKMSVTQVNAGTQHNVVPDSCSFVVDVRVNELYSNEEILAAIQSNVDCEVTARSTRLNSSKTPESHTIIKRAEKLRRECYGSPTLSDQALMPFPSVKIGPGESSRSHTAYEYIELQEIEEAIEIYFYLLDGLEVGNRKR